MRDAPTQSILPWRQVFLIMKLTLGLLLICLQISAAGLAQTVTLFEKNVTLERLFEELNRQTGYDFVADLAVAEEARPVDISVTDASVEKVLSIFFADQPLTYRISDKLVIVTRKEIPTVEKTRLQGKVSGKNGETLVGVSIVVKGTTKGTTTNSLGEYVLDADPGDVLVFSSIGYKSVEITVGDRTVLDVVLEEDVTKLGEVVVSGGYYETTDELKTGSIIKITSKDIEKQPVTSPLMALQGRVAGLEITPTSGAPGVAPTIRIRGLNSLRQKKTYGTAGLDTDGNYPLYIIDGVPVSAIPFNTQTAAFTAGGYDPLSTINPADIASIDVLKDGDATAMYGSRGANGVIIITTKRNTKPTERTNIGINAYTGVGQVSRRVDLLTTGDYSTLRKKALANSNLTPQQAGAYDLYLWDSTRYTDWQKELLGGTSRITDIQANVSSGSKHTTFGFNGGYHKETLVFPGDFGFDRINGQLTVNHLSADERFNVSFSSSYGVNSSAFFNGDLVSEALTMSPNAPSPYNNDGSLNWGVYNVQGQGRISTWYNPLAYEKLTQNGKTRNNRADVSLSYKILPDLLLSVTGGFNDISTSEVRKTPLSSQYDSTNLNVISRTMYEFRRTSWIVEPKISYTKKFGNHNLSFLVGGTWQDNLSTQVITRGSLYTSDALLNSLAGAGKITTSNDDLTEYKFNSGYSRLSYNWDDKYVVNLTGRRDGSSRFGPGNRYGNFGALGAAWVFFREKIFAQALPFLSFGKIRGSYGITGSDNIGDYSYYNLYSLSGSTIGGSSGLTPYALYNPNYAWEITKKLEGAIEMTFLQGRVGMEVDWYRNRSSNQLVPYPLSKVTGFESVEANFNATVQNTGWEFLLRGEIVDSDKIRWTTSINLSMPRNKLVKFDGIENSPWARSYKVGEPLTVNRVYTYTGVDPETGLYSFVDQNGDGVINDRDYTLQNLTGKVYYGGLNNTIQYKNFELSVLIRYSHRVSARLIPYPVGFSRYNQPVSTLNYWQHTGDITNVQRIDKEADTFQQYSLLTTSDYSYTDASFIRLQTLSFGYRFPTSWIEKLRLQEARVFLQGQNLFTFTNYVGLDPETGYSLPPLRMMTAGLQLKF